jgi:hypothetical protein
MYGSVSHIDQHWVAIDYVSKTGSIVLFQWYFYVFEINKKSVKL